MVHRYSLAKDSTLVDDEAGDLVSFELFSDLESQSMDALDTEKRARAVEVKGLSTELVERQKRHEVEIADMTGQLEKTRRELQLSAEYIGTLEKARSDLFNRATVLEQTLEGIRATIDSVKPVEQGELEAAVQKFIESLPARRRPL